MSIERYDCNSEMYHAHHGSFVRYDDHAATVAALREAAEGALHALESSRVFVTSRERIHKPDGESWYDERVAKLRAALKGEQ